MKKILYLILFILLLSAIGAVFYGRSANESDTLTIMQEEPKNAPRPENQVSVVPSESFAEPEKITKNSSVPGSVLLDIPFLSQAPLQVWDALHEDACEEASLIMVKYFRDEKKSVSVAEGDSEIKSMVGFEEKNGYELSITLDELDAIAEKFYGLKTGRVEKNITIDDIKKELMDGKPVIVGAAGKVLPNPNFRNGGPNYHMLVIKGYDSRGFITNDPGTRLGEGFRYTFDDMMKSIHDWNEEDILKGGNNYLVFD